MDQVERPITDDLSYNIIGRQRFWPTQFRDETCRVLPLRSAERYHSMQ